LRLLTVSGLLAVRRLLTVSGLLAVRRLLTVSGLLAVRRLLTVSGLLPVSGLLRGRRVVVLLACRDDERRNGDGNGNHGKSLTH
jgi:hypothetical protein